MLESLFNKVASNKILNSTAFFIEHLSWLLLENVCCESDLIRCSRPESFYNIDVRKNFAKFTGKTLCQSLSPDALSQEHLFYRTHPVAAIVYRFLWNSWRCWSDPERVPTNCVHA